MFPQRVYHEKHNVFHDNFFLFCLRVSIHNAHRDPKSLSSKLEAKQLPEDIISHTTGHCPCSSRSIFVHNGDTVLFSAMALLDMFILYRVLTMCSRLGNNDDILGYLLKSNMTMSII